MAYQKTDWKNREVEKPRTFRVQNNPDGTVTLVPAEGNIIEPGTPIIAEHMNKIEDAVVDVDNKVTQHLDDNVAHTRYGVAASANAKTVTLTPAPTALVESFSLRFKNTTANTGAATLNVNGLGAKPIVKEGGGALTSGYLKANTIYTVCYDGTSFILQGKGGEYGTATAEDVLIGKTIGTENGIVNGALVPGKKYATGKGNFGSTTSFNLTVNNLTFTPSKVLIIFTDYYTESNYGVRYTSNSPDMYPILIQRTGESFPINLTSGGFNSSGNLNLLISGATRYYWYIAIE